MSLNARKQNNGGNRIQQEAIEPGVYPSRLVQLIDLGLQTQRAFAGKEKPPVQEIMLTYELVDEFMKDEDGNDVEDKPRWVSETLPFYGLFADKAKSTQRYYAFDPKEEFEGDFPRAVGMPINITLVQNQVGDKTYTNVANIAAMRPKDAAACPELKNPTSVFSLDAPDMEIYAKFPEWIQKKIVSNLEFKGSPLEAALERGEGQKADAPKKEEKKPKKDRKAPEPADDAGDDEEQNPY